MFAIAAAAQPSMIHVEGGRWISRTENRAKRVAKLFKTRRGAERYLESWYGAEAVIVALD